MAPWMQKRGWPAKAPVPQAPHSNRSSQPPRTRAGAALGPAHLLQATRGHLSGGLLMAPDVDARHYFYRSFQSLMSVKEGDHLVNKKRAKKAHGKSMGKGMGRLPCGNAKHRSAGSPPHLLRAEAPAVQPALRKRVPQGLHALRKRGGAQHGRWL